MKEVPSKRSKLTKAGRVTVKAIRYTAKCGRGFWHKNIAEKHEKEKCNKNK